MWDFVMDMLGTDMAMAAMKYGLAAVGGFLVAKVLAGIGSQMLRDMLMRAGMEVKSAVLEVHQTYVDAIKAGKADGKLDYVEKAMAKSKAIETAKANLGRKGLERLMRVLGLDADGLDAWFGGKVEATVAELKASSGPR